MATNPYNAPRARVADHNDDVGTAKFWSFSGRLGRMRYVAYNFAANVVISIVLFVLLMVVGGGAALMGNKNPEGMAAIGGLFFLIMIPMVIVILVIMFMLTIQRVHDFNKSGWLSLLLLVPFVNWLAGLIFLVIPGTKGSNDYGAKPPPNSGGVIALFVLAIIGIIAYIGIIAAIAIPAYQGYVQKAHMMEQSGYQQPYQPEQR